MLWEALGWSVLAAVAPLLVQTTWPRWKPRSRELGQLLVETAPWLHGLGPPYLALISGAILERHAGLRGHDLTAWIVGAVFLLLFIPTWRKLLVDRIGLRSNPYRILDEPRWALYRATGLLWLTGPLGLLIGLALALAEWGLRWRWKVLQREKQACSHLIPLASSTILFAVTGNFYLTLLAQALLGRWLQRARE